MKAVVNKTFVRPSREWVEKFRNIPASIVSDCLGRYYAMAADIRPIYQGIRLCGPALTVQSMAGNNLMSHLALTFAEPGDVLVIDARGYLGNAVWGGVQALYAAKRGVAGLVVDGVIRDVEDMRAMKFPVYCKGTTPAGPHKGWGDSVNVPVQCGSMPVHPGDLILTDDDGVAIIPSVMIVQVYDEAMVRIEREEEWIRKIEAGQSSLDAVGLRSTIEKMEIDFRDKA